MKHLIRRLLTILLTISILTQCMPFTALAFSSQKPYISVDAGLDKGLSAVDAGGRGMDVNIDSNVDWEIYVVEGADWISTSCLSGSGAGSFYTIIDELPDTAGASREGWIVVSAEECDPIYIRVTQGQTNSINISSNRDFLKLIDISDEFAIRYLPDGTIETTLDAFLEVESDTFDHRNSYNRLRNGKYKAVSAAVRGAYALLTEDGTIEMNEVARHYLNFDNYEDFDSYKNWHDIVEIAVGSYGILALNKDGTVEYDCYVPEPTWGTRPEEWRDVIAIDYNHSCVGLRDDGRVYYYQYFDPYADSPYEDPDYRFTEMESWTDIVQLVTAWDHVVGLKADGTVVATGDNHCGQCNVEGWTDIVQIATGMCHTVGLRSDGTVVATGEKERYEGSGYNGKTNVSHLKNVQAVYATRHYTVALLEDGHFEVIGDPSMLGDEYADAYKNVVYSVKNWSPVKYTRAGQSENNAEDSVSLEVMLDSESTTDTTISTDNQKNMRIVNCNEWVSLRARPNTSSDRLAKVPLGATVECVDYNYGDFAYVGYNGNYGYILKEYLDAIEVASNSQHTHNFESKYATIFESIDDTYHQGVKHIYVDTCKDCGVVNFSEEPVPADKQRPLEHAYENGVCKSRGCEHVCGHNKQTKTTVEISQYPQDYDLHISHHCATVKDIVYCSLCDYEKEGESSSGFEAHVGGDVCTACGYSKKSEYYDILNSLPKGSNPMDNPIITEIIWGELRGSGMNEYMCDKVIEMISTAPATYRDIYVYSFFLYEKEIGPDKSSQYSMAKEVSKDKYVVNNVLSMEDVDTVNDYLSTWFHESGHAIDANYTFDTDVNAWSDQRYNKSYDYFDEMKEDVEAFIVAQATSKNHPILKIKWNALSEQDQTLIIRSIIGSDDGYPVSYDKTTEEWNIQPVTLNSSLQKLRNEIIGNMKAAAYGGSNDTRNAYMVTDCIEGMTNARATKTLSKENMDDWDDMYGIGKYYSGAHMSSNATYWYEDGDPTLGQCREAWAEYYSSRMTQNRDAINSNRYYFPSTCEYFDNEFSVQLLNHYKKIAKGK